VLGHLRVGKVVDGGVRGLDRGIITKIGGTLAEGFRLWRTGLRECPGRRHSQRNLCFLAKLLLDFFQTSKRLDS
jgi:hypothetical protein